MFDYYLLYLLVPLFVLIIIIIGVVALFNNRNNNMDPNQMRPKTTAKDFLLNLGAFISLYTIVGSLISLLFTVINTAYPKISDGYNYYGSQSISWPVASLIVFFPIFVLLVWFLEKDYRIESERQNSLIHKGLTYITLFISGCVIAGDLVTAIYYFIDGQELTTGFLLKVFVLLVIFSSLFIYYISDLRGKLTPPLRIFWRIFATAIIIGSIIWGFAVLGSPRTQRLIKYDEQKVSDLQGINNQVRSYYSDKRTLPKTIEAMSNGNYYVAKVDSQNQKQYEYVKTAETTYNLCAEFNKAIGDKNTPNYYPYGDSFWIHPAGHYCFMETINPNDYPPYPKAVLPMPY